MMVAVGGALCAVTLLLLFSIGLRRGHWRRSAAAGAATAVVLSTAATGNAGPLLADDMSPMATDTDPSFRLIAADLEFILKQIEISEAHAHAMNTGDDAYSLLCDSPADRSGKCVRDPMLPHGLRTVDGSFNNLEFDTDTGRSNRVMPRMLPIRWRDGEAPPPGAPGQPGPTSYEQTSGLVYDTEPRIISNLIVDNSTNNPLVADAAQNNPGADIMYETDPVTGEELTDGVGELYLPSLAADEGLSAPVNMWFVFFGQFFDHGLDLVDKSPDDAVIVPLTPDDPLWARSSPATRWLAMSRATNQPGPDGELGTADDVREHENRTTPWVDQNQTYTSHPAHQVFLREYELVDGRPVDTGRLLNGDQGGLATWDDVQEQAMTVLGIDLKDLSVLNVPQVGVDLYGNFVPGPNGFPQLITPEGSVEGSLAAPVDSTTAIALKQSFLDDIAHGAAPTTDTVPDPDDPEGPEIPGYDNVALGRHFI